MKLYIILILIRIKYGAKPRDQFAQETFGTITYTDGRVFEGQIKDGDPNGIGMITYPDGRVFKGQ